MKHALALTGNGKVESWADGDTYDELICAYHHGKIHPVWDTRWLELSRPD
jgi:hypothetical protein